MTLIVKVQLDRNKNNTNGTNDSRSVINGPVLVRNCRNLEQKLKRVGKSER
jgi:hypothetical protein